MYTSSCAAPARHAGVWGACVCAAGDLALALGEEDVDQGDDVWMPPELSQEPHLAQQPQRRHPVRQRAFDLFDCHLVSGNIAFCRDDITERPFAENESCFISVPQVENLITRTLQSELRQRRIRRGFSTHTVFNTHVHMRRYGVGLRA
jgi:hypothetical protein